MPHTVNIELSIDFKALASQKSILLGLILSGPEQESVIGIINLIDAIQDASTAQLSETAVFGPF